jgi:hypothetical protein
MTTLRRTIDNRLQIACLGIVRFAATFVTALALNASVADTAAAQSRPDTTRMSCASARALVTARGAIVLGTGSSLYDRNAPPLYDRYVVSRAHCSSTQVVEPAFVPTTDNRQCFIGYTCRRRPDPL